jgi:outer membrane protein assembly factor BamB
MMNRNKMLQINPKYVLFILFIVVACGVSALFILSKNESTLPISKGNLPKQPMWVFNADGRILCTPESYNSLVVFQTSLSAYAIDSSTGAIRWQVNIPGHQNSCASMLSNGPYLVLQDQNAGIVVLNAETGEVIWRKQFISQVASNNFPIEDMKVNGGILYVARYNDSLTAYNFITGDIIWSVKVPDRSSLFVITHDNKIILAATNLIRVYDSGSGTLVFEKDIQTGIVSLTSDDKRLYLAITDADYVDIEAMDIQTLESYWKLPLLDFRNTADERLYLDNDILYLSGDYILSASPSTGKIFWANKSVANLGTPISMNNKIFVPEWQSQLLALDLHTGDEIGQIALPINFPWRYGNGQSPTKINNLLIWAISNRIFAYRP